MEFFYYICQDVWQESYKNCYKLLEDMAEILYNIVNNLYKSKLVHKNI